MKFKVRCGGPYGWWWCGDDNTTNNESEARIFDTDNLPDIVNIVDHYRSSTVIEVINGD